MAEEIQNTDPTETPSSEAQAPSNAFDTLLSSIKDGDRQKYSTVEDALKSIPNAQDHIKTLEEKNRELEEKLKQAESVEKLMEKLEEKATSQAHQPQDEQVFDENRLNQLVEQTLSKKEQQAKAEANVDAVISAMKEKFGDKAEDVYEKVAAESGVGVEFLNQMAAKSPRAVLQLAGISPKQERNPGAIKTEMRSEAFVTNHEQPSAKVKMVGSSTEDLANAWRNTMPVES